MGEGKVTGDEATELDQGVPGSARCMQDLPWFRDIVHHDHPGIAVRFVAISAEMADTIPFLQVHAADEKAAHLTKPDGSLEKRVGSTHWNPLCGGLTGRKNCLWLLPGIFLFT